MEQPIKSAEVRALKTGVVIMLAATVVAFCSGVSAGPVTNQDQSTPAQLTQTNLQKLIQSARYLYETGRYDGAEAVLKDVLKNDPSNKTAPYYLDLVKEARFPAQPGAPDVTWRGDRRALGSRRLSP